MSQPSSGTAGQKRKVPGQGDSSSARKRQKTQSARSIPVQSTDSALSATGELDVASFVKAREYEINALQKSMQKARKVLATRAFQQVPRAMRRRTASHNVKKVPRRLRRRGEREKIEENTPTVTSKRRTPSAKLRLRLENAKRLKALNTHSKTVRARKKEAKRNAAESDPQDHVTICRVPKIKQNNLSVPPTATSKFKKRQVHKTWLPTHLWHAKRAHMTKPSEPLWRMTIPLSPTEKSYRPSHRASGGRGCVAWDISYMSTISCHGVGTSLINMLKALGFHGEGWIGAKHTRWKKGTRSAEGWVYERDNQKRAISPVTVIWCVEEAQKDKKTKPHSINNADSADKNREQTDSTSKRSKSPARRLSIRLHPSAFHQFWIELMKVAKMQRPQVTLEDLRFEVGGIEVTGPGSTEALLGVLKPVPSSDLNTQSPANVWTSFAGLTNPASLPQGSLLAFNVSDPRLHHPPKQVKIPTDEVSSNALTALTVSWPVDSTQTTADIFSHKRRYTVSKSLLSQKGINRRKALAPPGHAPESKDTDPQIPVMLLVSRPSANPTSAQGSWTALLPWKCVDSVWRSLLYYPLSSGGTPRFGGLDENRQIIFEKGDAWFPGDLPGTEAGMAWERTQADRRYDEWKKRPRSRRIAWDKVDPGCEKKGEHGRGWTCDWDYLIDGKVPEKEIAGEREGKHTKNGANNTPSGDTNDTQNANAKDGGNAEKTLNDKQKDGPSKDQKADGPKLSRYTRPITHFPPSLATALFRDIKTASLPSLPALVTVRIALLIRGTPNPCARIYRLPSQTSSEDAPIMQLRREWLALDKQLQTRQQSANNKIKKDKVNHRHEPKSHRVYSAEDLDVIDYVHPNCPPEVYAKHYGKAKTHQDAEEQLEKLVVSLMPTAPNQNEQHPACPGVEDLVGFVTSGAYNLAEGKGTAIGSIWLQRVIEGWREDGGLGDRQRRLCVVRNAGEGVGRLGVWEICG